MIYLNEERLTTENIHLLQNGDVVVSGISEETLEYVLWGSMDVNNLDVIRLYLSAGLVPSKMWVGEDTLMDLAKSPEMVELLLEFGDTLSSYHMKHFKQRFKPEKFAQIEQLSHVYGIHDPEPSDEDSDDFEPGSQRSPTQMPVDGLPRPWLI